MVYTSIIILIVTAIAYVQCINILHMMWTTEAWMLQSKNIAVVKSYIYHHPDLSLKLYLTDMSSHAMSIWRSALPYSKNNLEIIPITDEFLYRITDGGPCGVGRAWVEGLHKWREGRYFYSHLADFLRFCMVAREGGVYSDFDALLLRPLLIDEWLPKPVGRRTVIGKDFIGEGEQYCFWCLNGGRYYLAPGVMVGEVGSELLVAALRIGFDIDTYDPNVFNGAGPKAITLASKKVPRSSLVVLERDLFYPVDYQEAKELFTATPSIPRLSGSKDSLVLAEMIKRRSISLHFFGGQTKSLSIAMGSILDILIHHQQQQLSFDVDKFVTVVVKTMDRMGKVLDLVASCRIFYPNIRIVVGNDGERAFDIPGGTQRGFQYFPLPYDVGLSEGRNILMRVVKTPLVMILDDDFVFTIDSDLQYLLKILEMHKLDIVGAKIPKDNQDYSGLLAISKDVLYICSGNREKLVDSTCDLVDIVPNVLMARTASLLENPWDGTLKLGEHEDFFMRAKARGLRVATCRSVFFTHFQDPHWENKTPYDKMRGRVWNFLEQSLVKNNLKAIVAFGGTLIAIQAIDISDIHDLKVVDLQPFSSTITWKTNNFYNYYVVDAFDISDCNNDDEPGELICNTYTKTTHASISCLEPERYYRLQIRPANYTMVSEVGPEVVILTPPLDGKNNLIVNGGFDGDNEFWHASLGCRDWGLVPLQDPVPGRTRKSEYIWGRHRRSNYMRDGEDYGLGVSLNNHTCGLYQEIPGNEIPTYCSIMPCQVSVSAWVRVEGMKYALKESCVKVELRIFWEDGGEDKYKEYPEMSKDGEWQLITFSIGTRKPIKLLQLWTKSESKGTSFIIWDDFYLAIRPEPQRLP